MTVRNDEQKIAKDSAGAQPRDNLFDHRVLRLDRDCRARKKRAQLGGLRIGCPKIVELPGGRLRRALREGDISQSVCVLEARGLQFGLPSRLFTKLVMSASCVCGLSCLASSDSAPSTARFAASAFNARRAARSAASISAFAAAAIFCASLCVAARRRATSAAFSDAALPPSSAACAPAAAKSKTNRKHAKKRR